MSGNTNKTLIRRNTKLSNTYFLSSKSKIITQENKKQIFEFVKFLSSLLRNGIPIPRRPWKAVTRAGPISVPNSKDGNSVGGVSHFHCDTAGNDPKSLFWTRGRRGRENLLLDDLRKNAVLPAARRAWWPLRLKHYFYWRCLTKTTFTNHRNLLFIRGSRSCQTGWRGLGSSWCADSSSRDCELQTWSGVLFLRMQIMWFCTTKLWIIATHLCVTRAFNPTKKVILKVMFSQSSWYRPN